MLEIRANGSVPAALLSQAARRFAERIALRCGDRVWTFEEFERAVDRLAAGIATIAPKGARLALCMKNRPEYVLLQFAIERSGLVRVPLNARATKHEIGLILQDSRASGVLFDSETAERVEAACADLSGLWRAAVDGDAAHNGPAFAALLAGTRTAKAVSATDLDDICSINYTSGTSGRPKGVVLTHRNWAAVYRNMLVDRDIRGSDIVAHIGPLTHSSGAYLAPWLMRGASHVLLDTGSIDELLETIDRVGVTAFTCVPTVLTRIVNHPKIDRYDLQSLRMIGYGAEPIPRNTLDKALRRFGPILVQNYGLTEAMMTCATLPADEHIDPTTGTPRIGCIGRPYSFVEIVLRAPDGTPVGAGEIGEITIRSDHVMQGYWGMPAETEKVLRQGWLWSGDLGQMDRSGLITLTGRSKDMLISGGFNIYPQEVETILTSCPEITEAAVIGVPDADWGEIGIAFVSLAPGAKSGPDDIVSQVKPLLGIKTPKRLEVLPELPKTPNGKVDKKLLRTLVSPQAS